MVRRILSPTGAPKPISFYSNGMLVGSVLYSAGQAAINHEGVVIGKGNAYEQAKMAFSFLAEILKDGGMSFSDVVRLNFFIRSRNDIPSFLKVRDENLKDNLPALSMVVVEDLAISDFLCEVEFIACRKD